MNCPVSRRLEYPHLYRVYSTHVLSSKQKQSHYCNVLPIPLAYPPARYHFNSQPEHPPVDEYIRMLCLVVRSICVVMSCDSYASNARESNKSLFTSLLLILKAMLLINSTCDKQNSSDYLVEEPSPRGITRREICFQVFRYSTYSSWSESFRG